MIKWWTKGTFWKLLTCTYPYNRLIKIDESETFVSITSIHNYTHISIYWNSQCHVKFCDECTKLQKYGFRFIYLYESMYWFLSFKFGNTKIKMCPIRLLTWNVKTFRNVSVETMFREEILARKKKYFVTFQERKWHSNVPLAHVPWWHCSTIYHHFKIPCYSKGPSINDVGPFSRFYDPPPSPLVVFLLSKFRNGTILKISHVI